MAFSAGVGALSEDEYKLVVKCVALLAAAICEPEDTGSGSTELLTRFEDYLGGL